MPFTEGRTTTVSLSTSFMGVDNLGVKGSLSRKIVSSSVNNNGVIPSASGVSLFNRRNLITRGFGHNSSFFTTSFKDSLAGSSIRNGVSPKVGIPLQERRISPGKI